MSEMFKVMEGVPLPPISRLSKDGVRRKWPIDGMKVGAWFFVPDRTPRSASAYLSRIAKNKPGKYTTRPVTAKPVGDAWEIVPDDTKGATKGTGVWRTE